MKVYLKFTPALTTCRVCYGMKVIEAPGGNTVPCPGCKGKGFV